MASNPRAKREMAWHGVPLLVVGLLLGVALGVTVWSAILGDMSIGLVVGVATGLLVGIAMVDLSPPVV